MYPFPNPGDNPFFVYSHHFSSDNLLNQFRIDEPERLCYSLSGNVTVTVSGNTPKRSFVPWMKSLR